MTTSFLFVFYLLSSRVVSQWFHRLHRDYPYFALLNTLAGYLKNTARSAIPTRRKISNDLNHSYVRSPGVRPVSHRASILIGGRPQSALFLMDPPHLAKG